MGKIIHQSVDKDLKEYGKIPAGGDVGGLAEQVTSLSTSLADMATYANTTLGTSNTLIVAHRGASGFAPENTLPSYELAGRMGYKMFETDAMVTKDGVWILMHDTTLDRTTNGTGLVSDKTYTEIQTFIVDSGQQIAKYPNLKIPTMEQFLDVCKKYNAIPLIDLKASGNYEGLVNLIKQKGFEGRCHMICLPEQVPIIKGLSDKIVIHYYTDTVTSDIVNQAVSLKCHSLDIPKSQATKSNLELCHTNGLLVSAFTIYTWQEIINYGANGLDMAICENIAG